MRLTLHQLKVFETVARLSSFSRASEVLHLAQPTVSIQVKQLSDIVGMPLFEQIGKKIFLTEAGDLVQRNAREIFNAMESLEMQLAQLRGLKQGRLKIAVVTTAKYFVPRLLGPFSHQYPGIDIALDVGNRSEIVSRLSRNEDDLYIMGMPPAGIQIQRHPFVENPIVAVAPKDHPLAGKKHISLERLVQEPFLLRERGSGTRMATERFLKTQGVKLNVRMELGSNEAVKEAVALEYGRNTVPVVTAKGQDEVAERIIEEARHHGVYVAEDPQLLNLLSRLDVDTQIPPELYTAVAVILSWVYWLKGMTPGDEKRE